MTFSTMNVWLIPYETSAPPCLPPVSFGHGAPEDWPFVTLSLPPSDVIAMSLSATELGAGVTGPL